MISYITVRDKRKKEYKTAEGLGEIGNQVEWLDDRRIIRKETADENHILIPCLIPSKEAVIIVFGSLKDFASTAQAAVFNPNGSVRFTISPPVLVSEAYLKYEKEVGREEALKTISIIQPAIRKNGEKEIVTMWIGFAYDWFEVRAFDPNTGEFGECFGASRL